MRSFVVAACLLACGSAASAFDPTSAYQKRELEGFTVYVNAAVASHPAQAEDAMRELAGQMRKINVVVPAKALTSLKQVPIWVEWEAKPRGAAEFHVSAGWLKDHGYNPDKLRCVEINNARNFVSWSQKDQPWMVLHELAHAYHHTVLGARHAGLAAAYQQAMERRLYDRVLDGRGKMRKAYAATNADEYFAELSEAYFGRNDFAPFTRGELEKHDPVGFKLMQDAWGK